MVQIKGSYPENKLKAQKGTHACSYFSKKKKKKLNHMNSPKMNT